MSRYSTITIKRDSNMELLRIICMIGIVLNHYARHPLWDFGSSAITANRLLIQSVLGFGKLGVNCFILISGYYLVAKKHRALKSYIKLWLEMLFYSVTIPLVFMVFSNEHIGLTAWITNLTPIISGTWGFASSYFVMLLLSPYLNILANTMERSTYQRLLLTMLILWSVIPTLTNHYMGNGSGGGEGVIWYFLMYLLGGYLRLYPIDWEKHKKAIFSLAIGSYLFYCASFVILDMLASRIPSLSGHELFFRGGQKIPMVAFSVAVFLIFVNLKIKYHKWINIFASATFGVFLIHEQPLMRDYLWLNLFHNADYSQSPWLWLHMILAAGAVYIGCTVIELLRIYILEKRYMLVLEKLICLSDHRKG